MERNKQDFLSFWTIFCPFTPLTTHKVKILKNWKNTRRCYHFTLVYDKWQSHDVWFLRYGAWQTDFFVILDHLLFCPPNNRKNQNFEKMARRYDHFTHLSHKWESYDGWFLRYGVRQIDFFCYFGPFFTLLPT